MIAYNQHLSDMICKCPQSSRLGLGDLHGCKAAAIMFYTA